MLEDPYVLRLNIRHYQALLGFERNTTKRQQILRLLAKARAQLSAVEVLERPAVERAG